MLHAQNYRHALHAGLTAAALGIGKEADRLARAERIARNRAHAGKAN